MNEVRLKPGERNEKPALLFVEVYGEDVIYTSVAERGVKAAVLIGHCFARKWEGEKCARVFEGELTDDEKKALYW